MAKPVIVRSLIAQSIPTNAADLIQANNRLRDYQNAYIKAGWNNWDTSLKAAAAQVKADGDAYAAKLDLLKSLQDSLTTVQGNLSELAMKRGQTLATLYNNGYDAAVAGARDYAKAENDRATTVAELGTKVSIANAGEAAANARAAATNEAGITRAEITAEGSANKAAATDAKSRRTAAQKAVEEKNARFVDDTVTGLGVDAPTVISLKVDALNRNIMDSSFTDKGPDAQDYSVFSAVDKAIKAYGVKAGVSDEEAYKAVYGGLTPAQKAQFDRGVAIDDGTPAPASGGGSTPVAPITPRAAPAAPTAGQGASASRIGQTQRADIPEHDNTIGQDEYNTALGLGGARAKDLQAAIAALNGTVGSAPSTDIIGRAQQLFQEKFNTKGVKPEKGVAVPVKPAVDPLKDAGDPLAQTKLKALEAARQHLGNFGQSVGDEMSGIAWKNFEADPISQAAKDIVLNNLTPEALNTAKRDFAAKHKGDLKATEAAMTAFVVYNSLLKQGKL